MVPIHPDFFSMLKARKLNDGEDYEGEIIHFRKSQIQTVKTAWKRAKKKAGIKRRLRPYDCRHAFATELLRKGADLKATAEILGHTRTDTTTRIYQHTDLDLHRSAVNSLPSLSPATKISLQLDTQLPGESSPFSVSPKINKADH